MSNKLKAYITAVAIVAIALLVLCAPHDFAARGGHYLGWVLICVLSEGLWVSTYSGTGTITMASTAGLAVTMLWGRGAAMLIAMASTFIADLFVLKKPHIRVFFNTCQIAITTWVAATAFGLIGGPMQGLAAGGITGHGDALAARLALPTLAMFVGYLLANRTLVAGAVALSTERVYWSVLREDWLTVERLLQDLAAFLLSPVMVMSFLAIGYSGVPLFFAPLWLLNESSRRYFQLKSSQQQLVLAERTAAKAEIAAKLAHNLRQIITAVRSRAQMLLKDDERQTYTNVARYSQIILVQSDRMEQMAEGLMDFSGLELKVQRIEINSVVKQAIEVVTSHERFKDVELQLRLQEPAPELRADPNHLQQVLTNLLVNAAEAMNDAPDGNGGRSKVITVTTVRDQPLRQVRITVHDTGPGIPASNLAKLFEPHFTTKKEGHGYGLSTSYQVIESHGGRLLATSAIGDGATFTIVLPIPPEASFG